MRAARSGGVVGATSSGIASPSARNAGANAASSSSGTSGTIAPSAPAARAAARKALGAVLHDRVDVGEEQDRRAAAVARAARQRERAVERHAAVERALSGGRDRRAVGERIAVRDAEFDQIDARRDRIDHRAPSSPRPDRRRRGR